MNEESIPDLVAALRIQRGKLNNPFAFVRHYFRINLGIDDFSFVRDRPILDDVMQVEFGLVPDEVGQLTPAANGILLKFLHRVRTAPTEAGRKGVVAEIQNVRSELTSLPDPDPVATIAIKALGVLLGISAELAVGNAATPIRCESERRSLVKPIWDRDNKTLSFSGVHRKYRQARNQFKILDAFETSGWAETIANPLRDAAILAQTVKDMNRGLKGRNLIYFRMDSPRVGWKPDKSDLP